MSFRRSDAGVSNYKHFLTVDYKVYVEGKSDLGYWQTLFSLYRPELKCSFERRDGVGNLRGLIEGVESGRIKNVLVCKDADYDAVLASRSTHPRILETYGYSFENDFVNPQAAAAIVGLISPQPLSGEFLKRAFRRYLHRLRATGEWLLRLDLSCIAGGKQVLRRDNPQDLMVQHHDAAPVFSRRDIAARINTMGPAGRRRHMPFQNHKPLFPRYYCGHSMFFTLTRWCRVIVVRLGYRPMNASNTLIKNFLTSQFAAFAGSDNVQFMQGQLRSI